MSNPITQYPFKKGQFIEETTPKKQIYLHHTAGNSNPVGVYKDWETTDARIATCVVIGGMPDASHAWADGEIVQGFSSRFWAFHLKVSEDTFRKFALPYQLLDKISIGVEICNWGPITLKNGKYYNYVNREVPAEQVCELPEPYRGTKFYHAYTGAQIASVKQLLELWRDRYNIPIVYNEDIWDICPRALTGESGVFTHNSVRPDKTDITPQPKMIEMLRSLV